ncbi:MAG: hypothetical protein EXS37_11185 [Opitutus sp.]|nr:hypothetical protein [Opitutus sp.]
MAESEKILVYLILGATGSGRRDVLVDLIADGLEEKDRAAVMLPAAEAETTADAKLPRMSRWEWQDGAIVATLPPEATHVFFVVDGAKNPIDQIEVFKAWLEAQGGELARVLCVINTRLAEQQAPLLAWFEACVHFSDVVLLNKREGIANKWMSDFLTHFAKQYYPCVFEMVREDRVKNPALVLEPQARRMSHVFDAEQDWIFTNADGEVIDEQEESPDGEDEIEAKPEEDPYFTRLNGGRRVKQLPDIAKFLGANA